MTKRKQVMTGIAVGLALVALLVLAGTVTGCATADRQAAYTLETTATVYETLYPEFYRQYRAGNVKEATYQEVKAKMVTASELFDVAAQALVGYVRYSSAENKDKLTEAVAAFAGVAGEAIDLMEESDGR